MIVAVVMPAASWLDGSGLLAFRMYARAGSYRIHVNAVDTRGTRNPIAPTALAALTQGAVRPFLAGADHWTNLPRGEFLAGHLPDLARLACRHRPKPGRVESVVERKRSEDVAVETSALLMACP